MLQKREREPCLRWSSSQQPQNLPQCTLPYQRLHQSPRILCPYLQYQWEKTPPGLAQAILSGKLFEDRNWLLPKNYLATENKNENVTSITRPKPSLKEEPKIGEQSIISPKTVRCRWGPDCPFCKNQDKEDWDGKNQNQLQQKTSPQPKVQRPQARHHLNLQKPHQEALIDKYPGQTKTHQQWEVEMEH